MKRLLVFGFLSIVCLCLADEPVYAGDKPFYIEVKVSGLRERNQPRNVVSAHTGEAYERGEVYKVLEVIRSGGQKFYKVEHSDGKITYMNASSRFSRQVEAPEKTAPSKEKQKAPVKFPETIQEAVAPPADPPKVPTGLEPQLKKVTAPSGLNKRRPKNPNQPFSLSNSTKHGAFDYGTEVEVIKKAPDEPFYLVKEKGGDEEYYVHKKYLVDADKFKKRAAANGDWSPPACMSEDMLKLEKKNKTTAGGCGPVKLIADKPSGRCQDAHMDAKMLTALEKVISPCAQKAAGGCKSMKLVHWGFKGDSAHSRRKSCHNGANGHSGLAAAMDLHGVECDGTYYTADKSKEFFKNVRGCLGAHGIRTIYLAKDHYGHMHINMPGCNGGGKIVKGEGLDGQNGGGSVRCENPKEGGAETQLPEDFHPATDSSTQ